VSNGLIQACRFNIATASSPLSPAVAGKINVDSSSGIDGSVVLVFRHLILFGDVRVFFKAATRTSLLKVCALDGTKIFGGRCGLATILGDSDKTRSNSALSRRAAAHRSSSDMGDAGEEACTSGKLGGSSDVDCCCGINVVSKAGLSWFERFHRKWDSMLSKYSSIIRSCTPFKSPVFSLLKSLFTKGKDRDR
jgi:hypothetical protein